MLKEVFLSITGDNTILQGLVGGIVITALNMLGALAILFFKNPSKKTLDGALGFAAGVMLAASFTSLILPGIDRGGIVSVIVGIVLGTLFLDRADNWVPHVHFLVTGKIRDEKSNHANHKSKVSSKKLTSVLLFIVAITLHNMPEGLAVGVSFGGNNIDNALTLMLAIGLQNIPEGLAVAVSARNAGMGSLFYAAFTGIRAGLVEIPLAVLGAWAVQIVEPMVPYAMGFAAGAMLYVISDEIIPETHSHGNERTATLGLMLGLVIMLTMDVVLG